jgi:hypothetical protein
VLQFAWLIGNIDGDHFSSGFPIKINGIDPARKISMKFYSKPIVDHNEVPLADEGRLEKIIAHWQQRDITAEVNEHKGNRCYVVSIVQPDTLNPDGKLAEKIR